MRLRIALVLVISATAVASCGAKADRPPETSNGKAQAGSAAAQTADWPTYHRNLARTGLDASGAKLGQVRRAWTIDVDGGVLHALDPGSGGVRYRTDLGEVAHFATPAASGGRIFVGGNGKMMAFTTS